jgi:hypothetical protein
MSFTVDTSLCYWFARRTRSRHNKINWCEIVLRGAASNRFFPLMSTLRRWSDRKSSFKE